MEYLKTELKVYQVRPKCECGELLVIDYTGQLMSSPPQHRVSCKCGYRGTLSVDKCGGIVYEEVKMASDNTTTYKLGDSYLTPDKLERAWWR